MDEFATEVREGRQAGLNSGLQWGPCVRASIAAGEDPGGHSVETMCDIVACCSCYSITLEPAPSITELSPPARVQAIPIINGLYYFIVIRRPDSPRFSATAQQNICYSIDDSLVSGVPVFLMRDFVINVTIYLGADFVGARKF